MAASVPGWDPDAEPAAPAAASVVCPWRPSAPAASPCADDVDPAGRPPVELESDPPGSPPAEVDSEPPGSPPADDDSDPPASPPADDDSDPADPDAWPGRLGGGACIWSGGFGSDVGGCDDELAQAPRSSSADTANHHAAGSRRRLPVVPDPEIRAPRRHSRVGMLTIAEGIPPCSPV